MPFKIMAAGIKFRNNHQLILNLLDPYDNIQNHKSGFEWGRTNMKNITTKQFQQLTDHQIVWDLLVENYGAGVKAPFFEYALTSAWLDKRFLHLNRIWFDGEKAVAAVFYEDPYTNVYFSLKAGYEELAEEMVEYAEKFMPGSSREKMFIFHQEQQELIRAAEKMGYRRDHTDEAYEIEFDQSELNDPLPEGFHFVDPKHVDIVELARCTWKGFDHEGDKGPFEHWDVEDKGAYWSPQKAYLDIESSALAPPPHSTHELNVIIANEKEEYVCFSGMWWVPENKLAYMEPLCTIPEYRHMGLAAAALSEHYRRMKKLGAECMTGGGNQFYKNIGYNKKVISYGYKKHF